MRALVEGFERLLGSVDGVVRWIVAVALLLMTAALFFNSIGRSLLNISMVGAPAFGRLLVIWLTFLGSYLAVRGGSHITVDVLQRLLSRRTAIGLQIPIGILGAATMAYVTWLSALFTSSRFSFGQIEPMLEIPSGFFYLAVPTGGFLMTLAFLQVALRNVLELVESVRSDTAGKA